MDYTVNTYIYLLIPIALSILNIHENAINKKNKCKLFINYYGFLLFSCHIALAEALSKVTVEEVIIAVLFSLLLSGKFSTILNSGAVRQGNKKPLTGRITRREQYFQSQVRRILRACYILLEVCRVFKQNET